MAYPNAQMPLNHPFLGAAQTGASSGVTQPFNNPGMMPGMGPQVPPQQVGMVPGVPGSMGLNPAGGAGPVMTPPHVIAPTSAGLPPAEGSPASTAFNNPDVMSFLQNNPNVSQFLQTHPGLFNAPGGGTGNGFDNQGWHQAIQAWRGQRPDHGNSADATGADSAFATWRSQRPQRSAY